MLLLLWIKLVHWYHILLTNSKLLWLLTHHKLLLLLLLWLSTKGSIRRISDSTHWLPLNLWRQSHTTTIAILTKLLCLLRCTPIKLLLWYYVSTDQTCWIGVSQFFYNFVVILNLRCGVFHFDYRLLMLVGVGICMRFADKLLDKIL